jgi:hypothetical protein
MALDPVEFDTSTSDSSDAEPYAALDGRAKPAGRRKWTVFLWIPFAAVVVIQSPVCISLLGDLESARIQIGNLNRQVSNLQSENEQLNNQIKAHTQHATRSLEFSQVFVGKSADALVDTAGDPHLEQAGLEAIQFVATGPSALSDATAYGNLSIEFLEPDGDSVCTGELAIGNGESNEWTVSGKCSQEGEFAAGEWQIRFRYHGHTFSRTFHVDAP